MPIVYDCPNPECPPTEHKPKYNVEEFGEAPVDLCAGCSTKFPAGQIKTKRKPFTPLR